MWIKTAIIGVPGRGGGTSYIFDMFTSTFKSKYALATPSLRKRDSKLWLQQLKHYK